MVLGFGALLLLLSSAASGQEGPQLWEAKSPCRPSYGSLPSHFNATQLNAGGEV